VLATATTDGDGRISAMAAGSVGIHRLVFDTAAYFTATGQRGFYPEVIIAFTVETGELPRPPAAVPVRVLHLPRELRSRCRQTRHGWPR
jgi:HIUase/transthyretin family protein